MGETQVPHRSLHGWRYYHGSQSRLEPQADDSLQRWALDLGLGGLGHKRCLIPRAKQTRNRLRRSNSLRDLDCCPIQPLSIDPPLCVLASADSPISIARIDRVRGDDSTQVKKRSIEHFGPMLGSCFVPYSYSASPLGRTSGTRTRRHTV